MLGGGISAVDAVLADAVLGVAVGGFSVVLADAVLAVAVPPTLSKLHCLEQHIQLPKDATT